MKIGGLETFVDPNGPGGQPDSRGFEIKFEDGEGFVTLWISVQAAASSAEAWRDEVAASLRDSLLQAEGLATVNAELASADLH
jgi:hypothetical protein